ncbi:transketolase [Candidatus Pelagisphaera phototrophica]|uniref:transketolase n=1 Tax=Candidatus Pelagisphaera phototrophica TaxID=2684113 RepID=UPI0019DC3850|nr:transketolase [Candidatus Pelagisphaera phototrophica]QXD31791.1 transketolase [Candidatus Pelagisphaera phototrophica]
MNKDILQIAANQARGLAIDAVHACHSGHVGLPLGSAEIGAVLYGHALSVNPDEPRWLNRDRFILSGGHGSMFLYSWLHLAGFDLDLEELKNFRQLHSKTPGHPEFKETAGVESTTGPLGQGIGNAVGFAVSQKMASAKFNTDTHTILNNHIVALAGDGCIQEGVAQEASALAGHLHLDNLIVFYDSNDVTLDAMADRSQSEDTAMRYEALGWGVVTIDGHDLDAVAAAFSDAKAAKGKPQLIIAKTEIARGIPEVAGTSAGHGESGAIKHSENAHQILGLPEERFHVSEDVRAYFAELKQVRTEVYNTWKTTYDEWAEANGELAAALEAGGSAPVDVDDLLSKIPVAEVDAKLATRAAGSNVLQPIAQARPELISGSADLHGSTKNYIKDGGDFLPGNESGRNLLFGIREHAMGALLNGVAYDGIWRASGATFMVFADYLRPSIRLASLAGLPVIYIFTHDSVGVGEDGPTHQPVETVSGLRVIPNLDVIRPCDTEETAGAFVAAVERQDGPTVLSLTRQGVPNINTVTSEERRHGVLKGGYVIKKETGPLEVILIGTGSEVQHAIAAADEIGPGARVVSMPSMLRFDGQSDEYKESVLPSSCTKRIAIEAGVTGLWYKYVGLEGTVLGIDRFGISAPGNTVMAELGMTGSNVVSAAG